MFRAIDNFLDTADFTVLYLMNLWYGYRDVLAPGRATQPRRGSSRSSTGSPIRSPPGSSTSATTGRRTTASSSTPTSTSPARRSRTRRVHVRRQHRRGTAQRPARASASGCTRRCGTASPSGTPTSTTRRRHADCRCGCPTIVSVHVINPMILLSPVADLHNRQSPLEAACQNFLSGCRLIDQRTHQNQCVDPPPRQVFKGILTILGTHIHAREEQAIARRPCRLFDAGRVLPKVRVVQVEDDEADRMCCPGAQRTCAGIRHIPELFDCRINPCAFCGEIGTLPSAWPLTTYETVPRGTPAMRVMLFCVGRFIEWDVARRPWQRTDGKGYWGDYTCQLTRASCC